MQKVSIFVKKNEVEHRESGRVFADILVWVYASEN